MGEMTDAQAGWYPVPEQPGRLRWWSGTEWTDHYHDQPGGSGADRPVSTRPRPGPPLSWSIAILVVGIVAAVTGGVVAGVGLVRTVTSSRTMNVPGRATFHLASGDYLLYEYTGTREGGTGARAGTVTIEAYGVQITDSKGATVAVRQADGATETLTRGSRTYTGAVAFSIHHTDDYTFVVLDSARSTALVGRSLGDTFRRALPWITLGILGGLVAVAGVTMIIVGSVRRYRWSQGR